MQTLLQSSREVSPVAARRVLAPNKCAGITLQVVSEVVDRARGIAEFVQRRVQFVDRRRARAHHELSRCEG